MRKFLDNEYVNVFLSAFDWISTKFWDMIVLPTMYFLVGCHLVGTLAAAVMFIGLNFGFWQMQEILDLVSGLGGGR